jgi:hypothetical protein
MRIFNLAMAAASLAALVFLAWLALGQPPKSAPDAGKPFGPGSVSGRIDGTRFIPDECSDDITIDGKRFLHRVWRPHADGQCRLADAPVIRAQALPGPN